MPIFTLVSAVIAVVALSAYANHKLVHLPDSIGITVVALLLSLGTVSVGQFVPQVADWGGQVARGVNFPELVFHGLLGLLLFAGSLHVDVLALRRARWVVLLLATVGVLLSTVIVGGAFYGLARLLALPLTLRESLLFGALISPTDPIAALGLLSKAQVPASLLTKITGEALFNDGTGVVLFVVLLGLSTTHAPNVGHVAALFARQVLGGLAFGALAGFGAVALLRTVDSPAVEILVTLALATAGYDAALALGISAPIATVVMGLVVGGDGRAFAVAAATRERLFQFWQLTDDLLNLLLFGLVGLELTALAGTVRAYLVPAALALPLVLAARFVSVGLPTVLLRPILKFEPHFVKLMTWAGLRGALSVALALSLPTGPARNLIVTATYLIAIFSILVQATTVEPLARRWNREGA
ncbi:MAG: cation:proton antiporter [Gammaproteobacteria bacterium]|nr:cation:proton antiporter [Gammaproteobacteria bacterium]